MDPDLDILLVEDSEDDAILIVEELRAGGYRPHHRRVVSGAEMEQALAAQGWDIVISDHRLPGFSATEALQVLLDSGREIPFIIVSGTIGEELAVEAMKAGAYDYVMKGALAKLTPAVQHALSAARERRRYREAQQEIRESREQLRRLASHLESVREEERARLAREIHDELGGILTALKMDISWMQRQLGDAPALEEKLTTMTGLTDSAIRTMRRIITDLRPSVLDDLGLIPAIEWQLSEFRKHSGLEMDLDVAAQSDMPALSPAHAVAVFRIFQESLTNIARHAGARTVRVAVGQTPEAFVLTVDDDGRGMTEQTPAGRSSYGILGMRERARHLGGELSIAPREGGGTRVRLTLPLSECGEAS